MKWGCGIGSRGSQRSDGGFVAAGPVAVGSSSADDGLVYIRYFSNCLLWFKYARVRSRGGLAIGDFHSVNGPGGSTPRRLKIFETNMHNINQKWILKLLGRLYNSANILLVHSTFSVNFKNAHMKYKA